MKNNSLVMIKKLKPVLCLLTLILITFSCKKETIVVTPIKPTYTAADVVGSYTVKKSEWSGSANPLGIGPVGEIITFTFVSKDAVSDGYLTYHVDSTGFLSAPPRPNLYVVSASGYCDSKTLNLTFYVIRDNSVSTGNLVMTKP